MDHSPEPRAVHTAVGAVLDDATEPVYLIRPPPESLDRFIRQAIAVNLPSTLHSDVPAEEIDLYDTVEILD